jgi:hypothetical protein
MEGRGETCEKLHLFVSVPPFQFLAITTQILLFNQTQIVIKLAKNL